MVDALQEETGQGPCKRSGLTRSVATRQLIGQAQGIVMERHGITPDRAFARLLRAGQDGTAELREVAEQPVHSGTLPQAVGH